MKLKAIILAAAAVMATLAILNFSMAKAAAPNVIPQGSTGQTTRELVFEALRGEINLQVQLMNHQIALGRERLLAEQITAMWGRAQACLDAHRQRWPRWVGKWPSWFGETDVGAMAWAR